MEKLNVTKERFVNATAILWTADIITKNGITGYNLYIQEGETIIRLFQGSNYWSNKKECYHCTAWGTSRALEIYLSIGRNLGLKFKDLKQSKLREL